MEEVARSANNACKAPFMVRTLDFCTFYYRSGKWEERRGRKRLRISVYKWQAGLLKLFQEQPPYTHVHSIYAHTITHSSRKGIT